MVLEEALLRERKREKEREREKMLRSGDVCSRDEPGIKKMLEQSRVMNACRDPRVNMNACSCRDPEREERKREREKMKGSILHGGDVSKDPDLKMMLERLRVHRMNGGVNGMNAKFKRLKLANHDPSVLRVGWRVLILDDNHPNSIAMRHLFSSFGCLVHACIEPRGILSFLKQGKEMPDFVLCNIHMKAMDEATLFELVGLKDVLVIMMSTSMDPRLVTEGMNRGACSFILKPQTFDDIENISSFLLKRKKYPSKFPWNWRQKFDQIVNQLGGYDEAVPEKIQELLNAENIIPLSVIEEYLKIRRKMARLAQLKSTREDSRSSDRLYPDYRPSFDPLFPDHRPSFDPLFPDHRLGTSYGTATGV